MSKLSEDVSENKRRQGEPSKSDASDLIGRNPIESYHNLCKRAKQMNALPSLTNHIVNMVLASNGQIEEESIKALSGQQQKELRGLQQFFQFGLGPRAASGLIRAAKTWGLLWGNTTESTADGSDLAHILVPTLRHRLHLKFDWEKDYAVYKEMKVESESDWTTRFLIDFALATAPNADRYQKPFESEVTKIAKTK